MQLEISARLALELPGPADFLLQIEAAAIPEQSIVAADLELSPSEHCARVPAQDGIGERIWLRASGRFEARYQATVRIERQLAEIATLAALPPHLLPGGTVPYLLDSRYCPGARFQALAEAEFGGTAGGARIAAIREWIAGHLDYAPGSSGTATTALDSFVERRGVCRDYAHLLIALARASAIPARYVSGYAPRVEPQDFHAVAEVFLAEPDNHGGSWHLVDATGMSRAGELVKIGIGRDAADVSFLTTFGASALAEKVISVKRA
ncbi:MAG: transglutaminase family protein [Novosphingobium sp.]|nr:transglutaminase family protein [Novosphingobium sp.]